MASSTLLVRPSSLPSELLRDLRQVFVENACAETRLSSLKLLSCPPPPASPDSAEKAQRKASKLPSSDPEEIPLFWGVK